MTISKIPSEEPRQEGLPKAEKPSTQELHLQKFMREALKTIEERKDVWRKAIVEHKIDYVMRVLGDLVMATDNQVIKLEGKLTAQTRELLQKIHSQAIAIITGKPSIDLATIKKEITELYEAKTDDFAKVAEMINQFERSTDQLTRSEVFLQPDLQELIMKTQSHLQYLAGHCKDQASFLKDLEERFNDLKSRASTDPTTPPFNGRSRKYPLHHAPSTLWIS